MEKVVKEMLQQVIESKTYEEEVILQFFSPAYEQLVDHAKLDFEGFKQHIKKLKQLIETVEVQLVNTAAHDNIVFTKHLVHSVLKDGSQHTHKVLAEFTFSGDKIIRCEELTCLVSGSEEAKSLGSMT
ncbi:hypothetical protein [Myroides sp. DW712]|uniref:hypothetical protein n=1 Tax=Myroides sp. DW712 TaxID=3389800 RepID=UPI0039785341